jgi:hypothetical protein
VPLHAAVVTQQSRRLGLPSRLATAQRHCTHLCCAAVDRSVAKFMKESSPINSHIVALGVDAFLKMLLADNFYHSDMHPVRLSRTAGQILTACRL